MRRSAAEIVREYGPFPGVARVNGVTYDGQQVWVAAEDRLVAVDPASGETRRSIDVTAQAGTAYDGEHLFQMSAGYIRKIDPGTGGVIQRRARARPNDCTLPASASASSDR